MYVRYSYNTQGIIYSTDSADNGLSDNKRWSSRIYDLIEPVV